MEPTTTTPQHERSLVTGENPDERYPLPDKPKLRVGDGVIRAHDLGTIARTLIDAEDFPFAELKDLKIAYLWAEKGGLVGGFPAFGRMRKEDKVHRHFSGFDYIATLSVDHLTTIKATRWQVEALVAHQLGHIAVATTEKGEKRYGTKGHDFEGFAFEFDHYGVYLSGQVAGAESIALAIQMGMVFEEIDEDGDDEDYDPTTHLPPASEGEIGPVASGAPDPDWADRLPFDGVELETGNWQPVGGPEKDAHLAKIREDYGTRVLDDGSEVCKRCGIRAEDHPIDVCAGGVQVAPESTSKNGNGQHDDALPLIDPDRVIQTLSQLGTQIVYVIPKGQTVGQYQHPVTGEVYDRSWAESEYRGAISASKREKAGAR
jgi:hypothetical protein